MTDRTDCKILGVKVGTHEGWDVGDETATLSFYQFEPIEGCTLPADEVIDVDYDKGVINYFDDGGNITQTFSILDEVTKVLNLGSNEAFK